MSAKAQRAVVIGAGFGGLAAGIRLAARGHPVTVLERLDQLGGRARVFRQDGFTFDAGPTIVTAPHLLEELWQAAGRKFSDDVTLLPCDPFYRIRFDDGSSMSFSADSERMEEEIRRIAPEDVAGYKRFLSESEKIFEIAFEKLAHEPFHSLGFTLSVVSDLLRLRGYRTVYSRVASHFRNPKLRIAFSFHPLFIGGNPFDATAYLCLINYLEKRYGVHYALGGTGQIIAAMANLLGKLGGEIRLNSDVDRIMTQDRAVTGIQLVSGEQVAAEIVVSDADTAWTYRHLLRGVRKKRWSERKLARARYSMGLFVWYFGTKRQYPDLAHHTIAMGPRYRELLSDIFHRRRLAEDFSLYLHRPTASDSSVAPAGCDTFYALVPVPNLLGDTDWETHAEPFRQAIQKRLETTLLPGLGSNIVTSRVLTPDGFRTELLATHGAAFGMEPTLLQSAWFRPHNRSEEVRGLYLVGAGTHPGAGIPGVLCSAKVLEKVLPDFGPAAAAATVGALETP